MAMQHRIENTGKILDEKGHPLEPGWLPKPTLQYDRRDIRAPWFRIKEWDYYCILHPDYGVGLTLSDIGYLGLLSVSFLDFKTGTAVTDTPIKLLTRGKTQLPSHSGPGRSRGKAGSCSMDFCYKDGIRTLKIDFPGFNKGQGFSGEIRLTQDEDRDDLVILTPFEKKRAFYYNHKVAGMEAEGKVRVGDRTLTFKPEDSYGVLDWGRGVWTYKNTWYWGTAAGKQNGVPVSFNIGYGFGAGHGASENVVIWDGRAHKLDEVAFHIDRSDYLKPWKFTSNDGRFEMDFKPILDRTGKMNFLVLKTDQHQVFGYFSGTIILDSGEKKTIDRMFGFAERVYNLW